MRKKTYTQGEVEYCHICLPSPFSRCYNLLLAGVSPLIISVQGEAGKGKSLFVAHVADGYAARGYSVKAILTEQHRIQSAAYYSRSDVLILENKEDIGNVVAQELKSAYRPNTKGVIFIIDSIADVVEETKVVGARWRAQKSILEKIVQVSHQDGRHKIPTVAILLDQYRQGAPVPGTMIVSSRGTMSQSLYHWVSASFKLRSVHGSSDLKIVPDHVVLSPVEQRDGVFALVNSYVPISKQEYQFSPQDMGSLADELITFNLPYKVIQLGLGR